MYGVFRSIFKRKSRILFLLLIFQYCILSITGCWYSVVTRGYESEFPLAICEWQFSILLSVPDVTDKNKIRNDHAYPPEKNNSYGLRLSFSTISGIDTTLSEEERHEVSVDSLNLAFRDFSKTFITKNTFEDNKRTRKYGTIILDHLKAETRMDIGSVYIPPHTNEVLFTIYGKIRSKKEGLQLFKRSRWLKYEEKTVQIYKYD